MPISETEIRDSVDAYERIKDTLRTRAIRAAMQSKEWLDAQEQINYYRAECEKLGHVEGRVHITGLGCAWIYCAICGKKYKTEC